MNGAGPTPAVDAAEALAAKYAADWLAWGHRKIAAAIRADGHQASTSTVERAMRRRGLLLLPRGFRTDRKSWAALRRKLFHDPPTERNRVWQSFTCATARTVSVGALGTWSTTWPLRGVGGSEVGRVQAFAHAR